MESEAAAAADDAGMDTDIEFTSAAAGTAIASTASTSQAAQQTGIKRKLENSTSSTSKSASATGSNPAATVTKKRKKLTPAPTASTSANSSSLVELKGNRFHCTQKPSLLEKLPISVLTDILQFQSYVLSLPSEEYPLKLIPDDQLKVFRMLVHESDRTLQSLAIAIKTKLSPASDDDAAGKEVDMLPLATVKNTILSVAELVNFGLDKEDIVPHVKREDEDILNLSLIVIPPNLSIMRWQIPAEQYPQDKEELLNTRRLERLQIKRDAKAIWASLTAEKKSQLLSSSTSSTTGASLTADSQVTKKKKKVSEGMKSAAQSVLSNPTTPSVKTKKEKPAPPLLTENELAAKAERERLKQVKIDEDLEAKAERERVRQAKMEAKEERKRIEDMKKEEKRLSDERKQAAMAAQSSKLKGFFSKPSSSRLPIPTKEVSHDSLDWHSTFFPWAPKAGAIVASLNNFIRALGTYGDTSASACEQRSKRPFELESLNSSTLSPSKCLREFRRSAVPSLFLSRARTPSVVPCVRDYMSHINEAALLGNIEDGQNAMKELSLGCEGKIRMKLLQFSTDARPPYWGTWTRPSAGVNPRKPFGRDLCLDYTYDSDAEWEGYVEDCEAIDDNQEEDSVDEDEDDDDDDGFIDDDDVSVTSDAGTADESRKKLTDSRSQPAKKRDLKLTAMVMGPCWETSFGSCAIEGMKAFRMELLNDSKLGLNPFSFVSQYPLPKPAGSNTNALPTIDRSQSAHDEIEKNEKAGPSNSTVQNAPAMPIKNPLPSALLPAFLSSLHGSTAPRPVLIEQLKARFSNTTKVAINAKLDEVAAKTRPSKGSPFRWVVKSEAWNIAGIDPMPLPALGAIVPNDTSDNLGVGPTASSKLPAISG